MVERDIYIAIGSNVAPERHIPGALAALAADYPPLARSRTYRSAAVGFAGSDFVNCVVRGRTGLPPEEVVERLKALESLTGRRRDGGVGPRELDLDLLLYGDAIVRRADLRIPRPDILRYAFVLRPLAEIAAQVRHPETGRRFDWHWAHFDGEPLELVAVDLAAP